MPQVDLHRLPVRLPTDVPRVEVRETPAAGGRGGRRRGGRQSPEAIRPIGRGVSEDGWAWDVAVVELQNRTPLLCPVMNAVHADVNEAILQGQDEKHKQN